MRTHLFLSLENSMILVTGVPGQLGNAVACRLLERIDAADMRDDQPNQTSSDLGTLLGRDPASLTEGPREVCAPAETR
jgi:nucleoside-diphosphate-sugar epimerase